MAFFFSEKGAGAMKNILFVIVIFILSACASSVGSGTGATGVQVAVEKDIQHCDFLGDVHGVSSFYGVFAAPALESSRQAAMKRASELGATHIVWNATNTTYGSTSVVGDAYKCGKAS